MFKKRKILDCILSNSDNQLDVKLWRPWASDSSDNENVYNLNNTHNMYSANNYYYYNNNNNNNNNNNICNSSEMESYQADDNSDSIDYE
eukprot:Pgem_evm1s10897